MAAWISNRPGFKFEVPNERRRTLTPEDIICAIKYVILLNNDVSEVSVQFDKGDLVKVMDGPFSNFSGTVEDINPERERVRVMVTIFGRQTPVELEFHQVEKE